MASLRKSERLISSRSHGCLTIGPPQLPVAATRFPSHGTGRPELELRTATKLSSAGFEPTAVLTFGLRFKRLIHSATRSPLCEEDIDKGLNEEILPVLRHESFAHNFCQGHALNGCCAKLPSNLNAKVGLFILSYPRQHTKCGFSNSIILTSLRL